MAGSASATGGIVYTTSWGVSSKSDEVTYDGLMTDRSFGGILRVRSSVPIANIKKTFVVVHDVLTTTQKLAIETFYANYRDVNLDLLWKPDGLHYLVKFIDVPKFTILGGQYWSAQVKLAEV